MAGTADDIIAYAKAGCGDCCKWQFEAGQIDRPGGTSLHAQHRAVDFGTANCNGDAGVLRIYHLFLPLAQGPDYTVEELFCNMPGGGSWSHGSPSTYVDNPAHCHVGIRAGATLGAPNVQTVAATTTGLGDLLDPFGVGEKVIHTIIRYVGELPAAFLRAWFGGHEPAEVGVRVLEVLGGAVVFAGGLVMFLTVVGRADKGGEGVGAGVRAARRSSRRVAAPVGYLAGRHAGRTSARRARPRESTPRSFRSVAGMRETIGGR